MFGYVRPLVSELKVAQYEQYRGLYCGLCRAIGQVTGPLSRITLSYDFTFFAAVRHILEGREPSFRPMRCPAHPMNRRLTAEDNPTLRFSAAVSAAFADAKTGDDLRDERGMARLKPALRRPLTGAMSSRARPLLPDGTERRIKESLDALGRLEAAGCPSLDETAAQFGEALAVAFSLGLEEDAAELARILGQSVGRFVYLCDAADDLAEDVKRGRYNPIAAGWGGLALEDGRLSSLVKRSLAVSAPIGLEAAGEAAERLDPAHVLTPIVKNIIYLGLPASLGRILDGRKAGKERL